MSLRCPLGDDETIEHFQDRLLSQQTNQNSSEQTIMNKIASWYAMHGEILWKGLIAISLGSITWGLRKVYLNPTGSLFPALKILTPGAVAFLVSAYQTYAPPSPRVAWEAILSFESNLPTIKSNEELSSADVKKHLDFLKPLLENFYVKVKNCHWGKAFDPAILNLLMAITESCERKNNNQEASNRKSTFSGILLPTTLDTSFRLKVKELRIYLNIVREDLLKANPSLENQIYDIEMSPLGTDPVQQIF